MKTLLKEKILLEEPKLDDRRYLGDFEFEGVKYDITGEQSHTRDYHWEEIRIETSNFDSKVVGYGKYRWLNRPWQRFTFASALEQALIDWQGHKKEAYEAINESSDCLEAVNKFIEKISKKEESLDEDFGKSTKVVVTYKDFYDKSSWQEIFITDDNGDAFDTIKANCEKLGKERFVDNIIEPAKSEGSTITLTLDSHGGAINTYGVEYEIFKGVDYDHYQTTKSLNEDVDTGYDHYGAKNMYPFEGPAFIEYDGGPRQIEVIVKAKNGRYVWKNKGGCPDSEWCIFPSYADALKVQKVVGGEIISWNEYAGKSDEELKLKEDADKVNGDEEVLPAAVPEEPIVVSTDASDEINKEEVNNATYIMINELVQKEWEDINNVKSIIATLSAEENANLDVITILESAVDEKTVTVGMLTKASEIVNSKQSDLMQQGIEKAEEAVGEEFPADESLKLKEGFGGRTYYTIVCKNRGMWGGIETNMKKNDKVLLFVNKSDRDKYLDNIRKNQGHINNFNSYFPGEEEYSDEWIERNKEYITIVENLDEVKIDPAEKEFPLDESKK